MNNWTDINEKLNELHPGCRFGFFGGTNMGGIEITIFLLNKSGKYKSLYTLNVDTLLINKNNNNDVELFLVKHEELINNMCNLIIKDVFESGEYLEFLD